MRKNILVLEYIRLDILMAVIYCYLESEDCKVLEFHWKYFSYFEINAFLF